MAYIEKCRGNAAADDDDHAEPSYPAEKILPYENAPYAGKHDTRILQIRGNQCFAEMIGTCHGHLSDSRENTDQRQQNDSADTVTMESDTVASGQTGTCHRNQCTAYRTDYAEIKHDTIFRLTQIAQMPDLKIGQRRQYTGNERNHPGLQLVGMNRGLQQQDNTDEARDNGTNQFPLETDLAVIQPHRKQNPGNPYRRHIIERHGCRQRQSSE